MTFYHWVRQKPQLSTCCDPDTHLSLVRYIHINIFYMLPSRLLPRLKNHYISRKTVIVKNIATNILIIGVYLYLTVSKYQLFVVVLIKNKFEK